MTFNNETGASKCQTVVDAVAADKDLVPTEEEVERISALAALKPGERPYAKYEPPSAADENNINAEAIYFFAWVAVAFIMLNLLVLAAITMYVRQTTARHAEFHSSIETIEENVQDLHVNVQDLHMHTFCGDDADDHEHDQDPVVPSPESKGHGKWARKSWASTKQALNRIRERHGLHPHEKEKTYQKTKFRPRKLSV
jgi:hypothetical protein